MSEEQESAQAVLERVRSAAARHSDPVALRRELSSPREKASAGARLAAARSAHGAAERDRRPAAERLILGLIAAGWALGRALVGPGAAAGGEPGADAVRLLRTVQRIGLVELAAAAGPATQAVALGLAKSAAPRTAAERRRAAWAVWVGIGLAVTDA